MPLNKAKGNMYPFVDFTWNAVKGECPHGCSYCYMKRWGKQPALHFDGRELKTDLGSGNFIFAGSSCDMFAPGVPLEWIKRVIYHTRTFDNEYLFQTKNPAYLGYALLVLRFPQRLTIAATLETNRTLPGFGRAPPPPDRTKYIHSYLGGKALKRMVSIEPILDFDLAEFVEMIKSCDPEMVSIGAVTGGWILPEPPKEKTLELIAELEKFTTVVQKKNLGRLLK